MTSHRLILISTFITCACACLAYEAVRFNGMCNRFPAKCIDASLFEIVSSHWHPASLLVYISIFLAFGVVMCNGYSPKIGFGWFLFSFTMLIVLCVKIPGAMLGRWVSTSDLFALFYVFVVPMPAVAFMIIGISANRSMQVQRPPAGR